LHEQHDAAHQGLIPFWSNFFQQRLGIRSYPHSSDLQAILLLDPNHCEARELLTYINCMDPLRIGNIVVSLGWLARELLESLTIFP
jgi:hypothetical protein